MPGNCDENRLKFIELLVSCRPTGAETHHGAIIVNFLPKIEGDFIGKSLHLLFF